MKVKNFFGTYGLLIFIVLFICDKILNLPYILDYSILFLALIFFINELRIFILLFKNRKSIDYTFNKIIFSIVKIFISIIFLLVAIALFFK